MKLKIKNLVDKLNEANYKYYALDKPEMSDYEFDKLLEELIILEKEFPHLVLENSPTKKVGGAISSGFEKIKHSEAMLSLSNTFNEQDFMNFFENKNVGDIVVENKIDGLGISLKYVDGKLVQALTRGDGEFGENVLSNVKTLKTLPHELNEKIDLEVRGEIFMPIKEFERINTNRRKENKEEFANPRNAASGTLRQLDSSVVYERNLGIILYHLLEPELHGLENHFESLLFLKQLGLPIDYDNTKKVANMEEAFKYVKDLEMNRSKLPFEIDGAVVKINNYKMYDYFGKTSKFPKYAFSFKYSPEIAFTKINSITYQVGKTGMITPVAELEPVKVSGTTVSRVTLNNEAFINDLGVNVGDIVFIRKAGEIIPEITSVKEKINKVNFEFIKECPSCGESLTKEIDKVDYYCSNLNCDSIIIRKLMFFSSRDCMNFMGAGESLITSLYKIRELNTISDFFKIEEKIDKLISSGFGKKTLTNLIRSINKVKEGVFFDKFILSLGINNIGKSSSKVLSNKFNDLNSLISSKKDDLIDLKDFGDEKANSVIDYFSNDDNLREIKSILESGLNIVYNENTGDKLKGLTFVITGSFEGIKRNEISKLIESNGGKVSSSVSKNTNILIAGDKAGSKLKSANELGVKIINLDEFSKIIK